MKLYPPAISNLINQLARLPGIGKKTAARLAFYILGLPAGEAEALAQSILDARESTCFCERCQNLTDQPMCGICRDAARDVSVVCVVAEPRDVAAIERTREYKGAFHVLHGVLSPINGVGPDDLRIRELLSRLEGGTVTEVIMATNPDTEGDATALYLARLLRPMGVKVTRLAYGIPMGGHLEYADELTLAHALTGRREI
ncbi:MAG: recombination mediator RecR [Oscillospiraceae bacterium]|nr:recombination mediator RecR [Oscillospiraceae bacterium]